MMAHPANYIQNPASSRPSVAPLLRHSDTPLPSPLPIPPGIQYPASSIQNPVTSIKRPASKLNKHLLIKVISFVLDSIGRLGREGKFDFREAAGHGIK